MRLTKLRALELCEEMWRELAKTGNPNKEKTKSYNQYKIYCFACTYDSQRHSGSNYCANCPLINLWPYGCLNGNSPYEKWQFTKNKNVRKRNALIIADFCRSEIRKLKRKKK